MKYTEITHSDHPSHKLWLENLEIPFRCDGCKEVGIGSRYKCDFCDFDLHTNCAIPSPTISPYFYPECSFQFFKRAPSNVPRFCNACGKDVLGYVYHCRKCGFDLHPCCANLPRELSDGEMKLILHRKVSSPCLKCGRKGHGWSYRSSCKKYHLHVSCVKEMLLESWHDLYFPRESGKRNAQLYTRIPSLKGTLVNHHNHKGRGGRVKKCCEMAGIAVQCIISALLGDPTPIIVGVVASLISR